MGPGAFTRAVARFFGYAEDAHSDELTAEYENNRESRLRKLADGYNVLIKGKSYFHGDTVINHAGSSNFGDGYISWIWDKPNDNIPQTKPKLDDDDVDYDAYIDRTVPIFLRELKMVIGVYRKERGRG